jgi:hypothetical protein
VSRSNQLSKISKIASIFSSLLLAHMCYSTLVKTSVDVISINNATKGEMLLTQSFPANGEPKGRRRGGTSRVSEYPMKTSLVPGGNHRSNLSSSLTTINYSDKGKG